MPRRKVVAKRQIPGDVRFNSILVSKFINVMMKQGKKNAARKIFYGAMDIVDSKITEEDPFAVFEKAMDNVRPRVEVKSRRVGGSTYQVPTEVRANRSQALGIRWLISFARSRGEKSMAAKLAGELMDAANKKGATMKKKEDTHRMAEANRAFAHFRF